MVLRLLILENRDIWASSGENGIWKGKFGKETVAATGRLEAQAGH